jgi:hypothetical protein
MITIHLLEYDSEHSRPDLRQVLETLLDLHVNCAVSYGAVFEDILGNVLLDDYVRNLQENPMIDVSRTVELDVTTPETDV